MAPLHVPERKDPKGPTSATLNSCRRFTARPPKPKGPDERKVTPRLIRGRFFVYRYESEKRTTDPPRSPSGTEVQTPGYEKDTEPTCCGDVADASAAAGAELDSGTTMVSRRRARLPAAVRRQPHELAHVGRGRDQHNPLSARAEFRGEWARFHLRPDHQYRDGDEHAEPEQRRD